MKLISAILLVSVLAYVRGNVVKYEEVDVYNEDETESDDAASFPEYFENFLKYEEYELTGASCSGSKCCLGYSKRVFGKKFGAEACVTLKAPNTIIFKVDAFGKTLFSKSVNLGGNNKTYSVKINKKYKGLKVERLELYNIDLSKKKFCVRLVLKFFKTFKPSHCFDL